MIHQRLPRTLTAGSLSVWLLFGLILSMPASTLAATPGWVDAGRQLLPQAVTPDEDGNLTAGYAISIRNDGTSNISQVAVNAFFDQPYVNPPNPGDLVNPFPAGAPDPTAANLQPPVYAKAYINGREIANACPTPWGAPVMCSLGSLKRSQTATLVVAYQTTATSGAGIHAWWESTGGGSSFCTSGDQSHGDCLAQNIGPTSFNDTPGNYGGRFALDRSPVANAPVNGSDNPEQVRVTPPAKTGIAVTVADGDAITAEPACPAAFTCVLEDGTAEIHVGDGTNQYGLTEIEIEYDKSILNGINFQKLTVIHIAQDGNSYEEIPGSRSCTGTKVCATFKNLPGGGGLVTIYVAHSSYIKYH